MKVHNGVDQVQEDPTGGIVHSQAKDFSKKWYVLDYSAAEFQFSSLLLLKMYFFCIRGGQAQQILAEELWKSNI